MSACPHCKSDLPDDFAGAYCPSCDQRLPTRTSRRNAVLSPLAAPIADPGSIRGRNGSDRPPARPSSVRPEPLEDRWDLPEAAASAPVVEPAAPAAPKGFGRPSTSQHSAITTTATLTTADIHAEIAASRAAATPTPVSKPSTRPADAGSTMTIGAMRTTSAAPPAAAEPDSAQLFGSVRPGATSATPSSAGMPAAPPPRRASSTMSLGGIIAEAGLATREPVREAPPPAALGLPQRRTSSGVGAPGEPTPAAIAPAARASGEPEQTQQFVLDRSARAGLFGAAAEAPQAAPANDEDDTQAFSFDRPKRASGSVRSVPRAPASQPAPGPAPSVAAVPEDPGETTAAFTPLGLRARSAPPPSADVVELKPTPPAAPPASNGGGSAGTATSTLMFAPEPSVRAKIHAIAEVAGLPVPTVPAVERATPAVASTPPSGGTLSFEAPVAPPPPAVAVVAPPAEAPVVAAREPAPQVTASVPESPPREPSVARASLPPAAPISQPTPAATSADAARRAPDTTGHGPTSHNPALRSAEVSGGRANVSQRQKPVLASDVLREELLPREPGRGSMRAVFGICGAALIAAAAVSGLGDQRQLVSWGIPGLAALLIALLPLDYGTRAMVAFAPALPALALQAIGAPGATAVSALVFALLCATLPAAMIYRANFRASRRARVFIAGAILIGLVWLALPSGGAMLTRRVAGLPWALAHAPGLALAGVLLLSLLGFMGTNTTAAGRTWATLAVAWSGVAVALPPLLRGARSWREQVEYVISGASTSALCAIVAVAAGGLLAVYARPSAPRTRFGAVDSRH